MNDGPRTLLPARSLRLVDGMRPTPLPALGRGHIFERLLGRLERLDAEQLQVVEIVAAAIARGTR